MAGWAGVWTLPVLFVADAAVPVIFIAAVMAGYHFGRTSEMESGDG